MVVVTRLQDGEGVRLPFICRWSGVLPESAFVSLTRLQSNGVLQSGLGIDPAIYHHFVGPDNDRVYDTEHYVVHFLVCTLGLLQCGATLYRSTCFYEMRE